MTQDHLTLIPALVVEDQRVHSTKDIMTLMLTPKTGTRPEESRLITQYSKNKDLGKSGPP